MDLWKLAIEKRRLQLKGVYPIVVWQNGKLMQVYIKQKSDAFNSNDSNQFSPIKYETTTQMPKLRHGKSLWQTESNKGILSTANKIKRQNDFKTTLQSVGSLMSASQVEIMNRIISTTTQMPVTVPVRTLKPLPYLRKKAFSPVITSIPMTGKIHSHSLEATEESVSLIRTKETKAIETTRGIQTIEDERYSTATTTTTTTNELQPKIENFTHNELDYRKFPDTTVEWGMARASTDSLELPSTTISTTEQLHTTESTIQTNRIFSTIKDNSLEESINILKIEMTTEHLGVTSVVEDDNGEISTIPSTTETNALDEITKSLDQFPIKILFKPNIDYNSMDYVADVAVKSIESNALGKSNGISHDKLDIDVDDKQKNEYKMNETTSLLQTSLRNNFIRMNIFIGYFYALFVKRSIALNSCLPCFV